VRYRLVSVGVPARGFARDALAHYEARLAKLAGVEVRSVKAARGGAGGAGDAGRAREADALRAQADGYVVALDERGERFTSEALARRIADLEVRGTSRLTLWIGGADGLDPRLVADADATWRLSDLTLPHELAAVVALEQLYRVETIRAGHPYHRG
jgi:23S rRNA (pseudouridine1915-N3)-methyltransferase